MTFTGQLGTPKSQLANIELGFVGFSSGGTAPTAQAVAKAPAAQSDAPTPKGTAR